MSSHGYKPGELFRRTKLARVPNPSQNDTECQEDSRGNSLAAGVEQVSDDVELTSMNQTSCQEFAPQALSRKGLRHSHFAVI